MTVVPRINPNEMKVLAALASVAGDFGCLSFRGVGQRVRLNRQIIRRACRSLARKGLAEFHRALWSEDGEPRGSGYCATRKGCAHVDLKLVNKIALRMWDR